MESIISSHNKKKIPISKTNKYKSSQNKKCNCRSKIEYPLEGNFKEGAVYRATITMDKDEIEIYYPTKESFQFALRRCVINLLSK